MIPISHVSLSDALRGAMAAKELKYRLEDVPTDVAVINLPGVGHRVPAVVGFRSEVTDVRQDPTATHYFWALSVSPYEPSLLQRLLGRTRGSIDDTGNVGVSYDAVSTLREGHRHLSALQPPTGTIIQGCFAFDRRGQQRFEWYASSIEHIARARDAAIHHNQMVAAECWPLKSPLRVGKVSLWPPGYHKTTHKPVVVPGRDTWAQENQREVGVLLEGHFLRVLQSLWRATFCEGQAAINLKIEGYELETIGRTQIGLDPLGQTVRGRRGSLTSITFLG